jgi:Na+/H+-dicarboxylate symporter
VTISSEALLMKRSLTVQCIAGLILGILAGTVLARLEPAAVKPWLGAAESVIRAWTNALRLVVTPLVVAQLFVAIAPHRASKGDAAKLGVGIPVVFLGLLVFTMICALAATAGLLATPLVQHLSFTNLSTVGAASQTAAAAGQAGATSWLDDVIPPNLIAAAVRPEAILGLMLFTLAFALAARRLAPELQQVLETAARAVRDTLFVLIGWLLLLGPVLLFALGFQSAVSSGFAVGQLLLWYIAIEIVVLLVCTAALYPLTVLGGRVRLGSFARSAFPAQVTAAATRSSIATVPVLLRESETRLGIPAKISALVIPLGGAALKLSRAVSSPVKLLFLARVLGLSLSPAQLVVFGITIILLSPTTAGVPSVISGTRSLPAFVAVGIPPEYVILFGATTAILDVFLTVLNTTGYLSATVFVSRFFSPREAAAQPAPVSVEP